MNYKNRKVLIYISTILLGLSAGLLLTFVIFNDILGYEIDIKSLFTLRNLVVENSDINNQNDDPDTAENNDDSSSLVSPNEITADGSTEPNQSNQDNQNNQESDRDTENKSQNRFLKSSDLYGQWAVGYLPVAEVVIPEISYDQASSPASHTVIPIRQECTGPYLRQIAVGSDQFCVLDVPYVNQSLDSRGVFTQNPSGVGDVNYMCTTAASVMIAGYYNKVQYQTVDELREHMYMSKSNPELVKDNVINFKGRDIKLCTDGAFGLTSFNYSTGQSHCNWSHNIDVYPKYLGLSVVNISLNYDNIANNLTNGSPIMMSISPRDDLAGGIWEYHSVVVTGFSIQGSEHKILLNDPFRDLSEKNNDTCGGLTLGPSMSGYNSVYNFDNPVCARANYAWVIY